MVLLGGVSELLADIQQFGIGGVSQAVLWNFAIPDYFNDQNLKTLSVKSNTHSSGLHCLPGRYQKL